MKYFLSICFLISMTILNSSVWASEEPVGTIKKISGDASIIRAQTVMPASIDDKIHKGDVIKTGGNGSLGIIFKDNGLLSLGPNSTVVIDEFHFAPSEGKLSFITRFMKGTAVYLSGIIAKLSPESLRFETPVGTVGIRGTKFLVKIDEN